jgi:predicted ATPase
LINILFSKQSGGQSTLTPIQVSEYGAITNWPEDFFEQSQRDNSALIKAASEKRRKHQDSKS